MIRRFRKARFPEVKTLDTCDFAAADDVDATQVHALAHDEWVTAPENLTLAGPIGTGKTYLAITLGVAGAGEGDGGSNVLTKISASM